MISRLSTFAAVFAIVVATSLAVAGTVSQAPHAVQAKAVRTVQLAPVVIVAKRQRAVQE